MRDGSHTGTQARTHTHTHTSILRHTHTHRTRVRKTGTKCESTERKAKQRHREKRKKNTHKMRAKYYKDDFVLFIAVRLTTIHIRTCCLSRCRLPLFSTNPFVIHAILPILFLCFLLAARIRLPFTSYFVFIYFTLRVVFSFFFVFRALHVFARVLSDVCAADLCVLCVFFSSLLSFFFSYSTTTIGL